MKTTKIGTNAIDHFDRVNVVSGAEQHPVCLQPRRKKCFHFSLRIPIKTLQNVYIWEENCLLRSTMHLIYTLWKR